MAISDNSVGVVGNNPWDRWVDADTTLCIALRTSDSEEYVPGKNSKFVFKDDMTKDLKGFIAVYEFYCGCIDNARSKAFAGTDDKNCFDVEFNACEKDAVIYTVSYFGWDEVINRLDKYEKDVPQYISNSVRPIAKLRIKKDETAKTISFVCTHDGEPLPKFTDIK